MVDCECHVYSRGIASLEARARLADDEVMSGKSNARVVYSTETAGKCPVCGWPQRNCQCSSRRDVAAAIPARIVAKLRVEKKGRGGKTVTVVYGLPQNSRVPERAEPGTEARVRNRRHGDRGGRRAPGRHARACPRRADEAELHRQGLTHNLRRRVVGIRDSGFGIRDSDRYVVLCPTRCGTRRPLPKRADCGRDRRRFRQP